MKIVNAVLTRIFANIKLTFQKAFTEAKPQWPKVAMKVTSTARTETYAWLGSFPSLRKWIGEKVVKQLKDHGYSITNEDFEATISVKRNDLEDDQTGGIKIQAQATGEAAAAWPDENVFPLLKNGTTNLCFDGQPFFDTEHPVGDGESETLVSNMSGSGHTPWYLLDSRTAIKALVFQERKKPVPVSQQSLDSPDVFNLGELKFGVEARGSFGYGLWQKAHRSEATLDAAGFAAAKLAMRTIKSDAGRPLDIIPNVIVVPPSLEADAKALFQTATLSGGGTNPNFNAVEVVVSSYVE